jgi:FkbM family methyltransferase
MNEFIQFFNRDWLKSLGNVLFRYYYPGYQRIDTKRVKVLETDYGLFYNSRAMQSYPNLFEELESYRFDDIKKTDIVLDIGACLGSFTIAAAQKAAFVIAVEPLFYSELCDNVRLNQLDNVFCLPFALGIGYGFGYDITFCGKTQNIKTDRLDAILTQCPKQPNFLKIDCEGGEWSTYPKELTAGMRAVEGEFHNFSYLGKKQDPYRYLRAFQELGFECECETTPEKQLMIHARR